jgi:hypothetical protein
MSRRIREASRALQAQHSDENAADHDAWPPWAISSAIRSNR